ncbi:MAG TPA: hypothetical protein VEG32_07810 [Clostridia bacterium]|nr:hypothetical protein [Clostridia bacterium]
MIDKDRLAQEARNLGENEAFQLALGRIRMDALEGLVRTPATDIEAIRDHQARVRVVDDLRGNLEAFIRNGQPRKPPGIV